MSPSHARDRLTVGLYLPDDESDPLGGMEHALSAVIAAEPLEHKLEEGLDTRLHPATMSASISRGVSEGVIDRDEAAILERSARLM